MAVIPEKSSSLVADYQFIRRRIREWTIKPWFAAFTAMSGGLAGMLGGVYSSEIKTSFPLAEPGPDIVWHAMAFWMMLAIFGYCFKLNISAQNEAQGTALAKLNANTEKLEVLIRTLPDEGFLSTFEDYYKLIFDQSRLASTETATEGEVRDAILGCLGALAHLAQLFDRKNVPVRYAINVMLFKELPVDAPSLDELLQHVRFAEKDVDHAKWEGVLDLQCDCALVMYDTEQGVDKLVKPFAMPIPHKNHRTDGKRSTVLAGAAEAFCYQRTVIWQDTSTLAEWCRNESGLRRSLADEIEEYFSSGPGEKIKSFASLPFGIPDSGSNEYRELLGVVNIHSDREDILGEAGLTLFVPLTVPFRIMLAELFKKLPVAA